MRDPLRESFKKPRRDPLCLFLAAAMTVAAISIATVVGNQKSVNNAERAAAGTTNDSHRYYPAHVGNILYFRASKKSEPGRQLYVKVQVVGLEKKEDGEYFYYYGRKVNIRYLIGVDKEKGIYMRVIKYPFPLLGFPVEVDVVPKMQILRFPMKTGEKWQYRGKAKARLLFIPITRNVKADFEVVEHVTMKTQAGKIDAYHLRVLVDLGDGKGTTTEQYWYARDIGYSVADTSEHWAEITGYRIFSDQEDRFIEKLPENPAKYE